MIPSLRDRLRRAFAAAVAVALVITAAGVVAVFGLLDARSRVIDQADPASLAAQQLLGALVDQETGVRAFVLTGNQLFLEPYESGLTSEASTSATLRDLLSDDDSIELLAAVTAATGRWHDEYATPTVEGVKSGATGLDSAEQLAAGRRLFDEIRARLGALQSDLGQQRVTARDDLNLATYRLIGALAALAVITIVAVGALYAMVRRRVERPLEHLRGDARAVAAGDFDHTVVPVGHAEFHELALAMEQMRQRIVADFVAASAARDELERQTRDLARSNAELEQFAYVASHDLQEPLRKVSAFCQLLQARYGEQLDERADQYIEFAVDGAKRMQILINDLLTFSRVGRTDDAAVVVGSSALVDDALANLSASVEETGAKVVVEPLPAVQIERALGVALFQNLIGNAIKFRRPGTEPTITVRCRRVGPDEEFAVVDDGIGIEDAYAERVFVIFQRLHTKEAYPGTGIGLALCRKIVERHGGRIWIDPDAEVGTTIRFTLPVVRPEEVRSAP